MPHIIVMQVFITHMSIEGYLLMLFPKGRPTAPGPSHHGAPSQQRPPSQVRPLVSSQHLEWSGAAE